MTKKKKHAGGRPPWIPPDLAKVESLAARGLNMEQIAHCLGIATGTLYDKKNKIRELSEAIKRGQDKGISVIANALFEAGKSGNITAQIFYLKCRAHWKEANVDVNLHIKQEDAIKSLE